MKWLDVGCVVLKARQDVSDMDGVWMNFVSQGLGFLIGAGVLSLFSYLSDDRLGMERFAWAWPEDGHARCLGALFTCVLLIFTSCLWT